MTPDRHFLKAALKDVAILVLGVLALLCLSLFLLAVTWLAVDLVDSGIDAHMTSFQQVPVEGWAYWRWYYFKRSLPGNVPLFGLLVFLWMLVGWGWFRVCKGIKLRLARSFGDHENKQIGGSVRDL
jgi:hypothetical protein